MKQVMWFIKNMVYGFSITFLVLSCLVSGVYFSSIAEQNTRKIGFGEEKQSAVFCVDRSQRSLCLFGKTFTLP